MDKTIATMILFVVGIALLAWGITLLMFGRTETAFMVGAVLLVVAVGFLTFSGMLMRKTIFRKDD